MRIGVVSDTHNHLPNVSRIVELFNAAGVDRVVHTGDITQPKTLEVLARLDAPLCGVYGNNDIGELENLLATAERLGFDLQPGQRTFSWAERRVLVVHDPLEFEPELADARSKGAPPDVILHGHDHRYRLEEERGAWVFNPGECAGHVKGLNAVGVVDLASLTFERVRF